jgi:pimeloyl-ACP methyl ester carboxylesterase
MVEVPDDVHVAAGRRMAREQPMLHFLYREIDALNAPRTREDLGALLRAAGAPTCDEASGVRAPVLFIVGEEDPLIPPPVIEAAARCFPDARVERVPEAGHSVYFERPDAFNALVERFVAS